MSETDELERPQQVSAETRISQLVDDLVAAIINAKIYWPDHPRVQESIRSILTRVATVCTEERSESITIAIAKDFLVYEKRPLLGATLSASRFITSLKAWGAGGICVMWNATESDFRALLEALAERRGEQETFEKINEAIGPGGSPRVALLPAYQDVDGGFGSMREASEVEKCYVPLALYQSVMKMLEGVTVSVSTGGSIDFAPVREHAEQMLRRLEADEGALLNLARQDQYDAFTFGHSVRVSVLALNFGRALTRDSGELIRLGTAALLHDVGKSRVPFEVLHSNKPLSHEERQEINRHPEYGAEILIDHCECDDHAVAAAFGHHCGNDLNGYPKSLHEHQVSMVTDIVGIVDVFEALTAARPYKRPMSPIRAYRIMMDMRGKFDSRLLRRFIEVNGVYPSGQLVKLSTGELARVLSQTGDLIAPKVRILTDVEANHLFEGDQRILDLSESDPANAVRVIESLRDDHLTLVAT
jgi:HD-GYP domain-containing protein (c-di-GMP phosphodiesterase class II)